MLIVYVRMSWAQWQESLWLAEALLCKNGAVSDLEGGVWLPHSDGRNLFEPFSSSFCPNWRESGVQLTEKQAVLLMHDIYKSSISTAVTAQSSKYFPLPLCTL